MEDSQIIDLYWQRSEDAIRQTDLTYGPRLRGLAEGILRSPEDSQECVSDTYFKAWQTIPPQRPAYFFAYLAKICRFLAFGILDRRNAQKRQADIVSLSSELEQCIPDPHRDSHPEAEELGRLLTQFLAAQDAQSRIIFLRRYWHAQSIQDIARALGITQSKVKTRLHRTREKLRQHLAKEGFDL